MNLITQIYGWTNKDLGHNEVEFWKNVVATENEFIQIDKLENDYKTIVNIYEFKLHQINVYYDQIEGE